MRSKVVVLSLIIALLCALFLWPENTESNTGASVEVSRVIGGTVTITFTPPANYELVCIETATRLLECLQPGKGIL